MADEVESIKSKGVFINYLWFLSKQEKWKNKSNLSNVKKKERKEMTGIGGVMYIYNIAINKYIWISSSPPSNQSDCVHFLKGGFFNIFSVWGGQFLYSISRYIRILIPITIPHWMCVGGIFCIFIYHIIRNTLWWVCEWGGVNSCRFGAKLLLAVQFYTISINPHSKIHNIGKIRTNK